jgi:hypothetical protein
VKREQATELLSCAEVLVEDRARTAR